MVNEIWVYIALLLGCGIGFGLGIWFCIEFLKMFPSFEIDEKDIP